MTRDEQARQRLVEIALEQASWVDNEHAPHVCLHDCTCMRATLRRRAGFRDPSKGHWCAAGLTAAMEDAGLLVPEPGTPARRGAVALLDFVAQRAFDHSQLFTRVGDPAATLRGMNWLALGDIIAWLQHPPPDPAGWRRGHVAVIVAVDDESITTVGWNEGNAPGRVMKRRLWRDPNRKCVRCGGLGWVGDMARAIVCPRCSNALVEPRPSTVLWRRPGGLYGVARPVAR